MCTGSCDETPRLAPWSGQPGFLLALALPLMLICAPAPAADLFSTDWAQGAKSQARLIAAGGALAGFEVKLAPGAITYWRDPGDSGLPPTFDFSGSENVAKVEPLFPAPKRITESDGGEAFGYDGGVVFPLRVKPLDPARPATLKLNANFAVCEKVCLPAKAQLELTLPVAANSPYRGAIDAALAAVPRVVPPKDSARSRPRPPTAGASARRIPKARRPTCSSNRRRAGGSRSRALRKAAIASR